MSRRSTFLVLCAALWLVPASVARAADMIWSTYLGGGTNDYPYRVATDLNGDIYITGSTESTDYPTTSGAFQRTKSGGQDVFVTKLKGDGSAILWSTYLGGSSTDNGLALAVDANNNVYVAGNTTSTDLPVSGGAFRRTYSGGGDGFVAKFSSTGALGYLTYLGGFSDDAIYDIAVDGSGNAAVVGASGSVDFPITSGVVKPTLRDSEDGFVSKLSASGGQLLYSTFVGSDGGTDVIYGIAFDGQGQATVTGWTNSPAFPTTPGVFGPTFNAFSDGFVTRLNSGGTAYVYSTYVRGSGYDEPWTVAVDGNGNAYVAGRTASPDFPVSGGFQRTKGGGTWDGFVLKISPDARSLVYGTYLGGSGDDYVYGLKVNNAGEACVAGYSMSTNFPVTGNASDGTANGGADAFLSRLSASGGSLAYSSYLGGAGADYGLGIALKASSQVVVTGSTSSTNFPVARALDPTMGGTTDGFVSQLAAGTSGAVGIEEPLTSELTMSAPYPNPFRDRMALGCSLRADGRVSVRVLDLQGRLVQTLAAGLLPAGHYDWSWDGRDARGRDAGTGMFLLEATVPGARVVKQVVRLR